MVVVMAPRWRLRSGAELGNECVAEPHRRQGALAEIDGPIVAARDHRNTALADLDTIRSLIAFDAELANRERIAEAIVVQENGIDATGAHDRRSGKGHVWRR